MLSIFVNHVHMMLGRSRKTVENCLRKILEIRVSRFLIDRKSLLIDRTSQMVEFKFFNFFDQSRGTLDRSKEGKSEFFLSVFTCKKSKTMCN